MTALLYCQISSNLTKTEKLEIDALVAKNQELVFLFVKKFPSNSKRRLKKAFLYGIFLFQLGQPLVPCITAVMLPLPPVAIHRLSPFEQDRILGNKNYYPQIATILASRMDKVELTNYQIQQFDNIAIQLSNGSMKMEEAILQMRGGDGLIDVVVFIAVCIFLNWYDSSVCVDVLQANPLPHQDPVGWFAGKYNPRQVQYRSRQQSIFERQMTTDTNMCPELSQADENGFVMSYKDVYNLVKETYPGYLQVNESCKITDWQAVKHIYHSPGMGIDPEDYGFTHLELERIRGEKGYKEGGLIAYVRRGHRLPPIEMVRAYQLSLKESCENANIKRTNVPYYGNNHSYNATVFAILPTKGSSSGIIIAFNQFDGNLITGYRHKSLTFETFLEKNYLGSSKWIVKPGDK